VSGIHVAILAAEMAAGPPCSGCSVCVLMDGKMSQSFSPEKTKTPRPSQCILGKEGPTCHCRVSLAGGDLKSSDCLQGPWFRVNRWAARRG